MHLLDTIPSPSPALPLPATQRLARLDTIGAPGRLARGFGASTAFLSLSPGLACVFADPDGAALTHQALGAAGMSAHQLWNAAAAELATRAHTERGVEFLVRSPAVISILTKLIGPGLRLHGSKLNMKSAQYGSPVEWHQDWAFYPHTNDDILAIGVLLDDCDLENGPMLVTPGTHTGATMWDHHGEDGCFAGLIDPDQIQDDIKRAVPCMGKAGSMSFHHVRALHGSATNTSNRPRNLLLYEVAASDAWPLMGVKDFDEFNSRLLAGPPVVAPRLTDVPVRMPLPPAKRQGSIYETQSASKKSYFTRAA